MNGLTNIQVVIIVLVCVLCVTVAELYAINQGINGKGLKLYQGCIIALAGNVLPGLREWLKKWQEKKPRI